MTFSTDFFLNNFRKFNTPYGLKKSLSKLVREIRREFPKTDKGHLFFLKSTAQNKIKSEWVLISFCDIS